jgi:hypothetical protein
MAAYLGYDEVKDKLPFPKKQEEAAAAPEAGFKEEAEKYKQEAERLRAELEKAKATS